MTDLRGWRLVVALLISAALLGVTVYVALTTTSGDAIGPTDPFLFLLLLWLIHTQSRERSR